MASANGNVDKWVELTAECKYLPENELKQLCDLVCDLLLEESNIQPVSSPVTVCGDIHGQVRLKPPIAGSQYITLLNVGLVLKEHYSEVSNG